MSQSLLTGLRPTSELPWEYSWAMSKLWVHFLPLSSTVCFFRVKKGLLDSRVIRYVYPKASLLGVMFLGLRELI